MRIIKYFLAHYSFTQVWVLIFLLTLLIILTVQLFLLPYLFPSWHAGDGLLIGGDWIAFHNLAVNLAENIKDQGWSQWELWPRGWFPAGIASALYAIIWPSPLVLAPLNAAVHACTAIMVIKIMLIFTKNRGHAFIAALPFLFFPSAMLWYTQIHRDGYNILGMLLLLYALLLVVTRRKILFFSYQREIKIFVIAFFGILLLWVSRPHTLIMFQYTTFIIAFIFLLYFVIKVIIKHSSWKEFLIRLILLTGLFFIFLPFIIFGGGSKYELLSAGVHEHGISPKQWASTEGPGNLAVSEDLDRIEHSQISINEFVWHRSSFLPERLDNHLYTIASIRSVWYPISYSGAMSYIDRDVAFHSAVDFIFYLPRALQIAYLSPFPSDWFGEGTYGSTTFFRRVSAFEMVFIYFALGGFIMALWFWRKKIEVYLVYIFCTLLMLPVVYGIPNLGTLYRYRYGYIMLVTCLGVLKILERLGRKRGENKAVED